MCSSIHAQLNFNETFELMLAGSGRETAMQFHVELCTHNDVKLCILLVCRLSIEDFPRTFDGQVQSARTKNFTKVSGFRFVNVYSHSETSS